MQKRGRGNLASNHISIGSSDPEDEAKLTIDAYVQNDINEIIEKEKSRTGSFLGRDAVRRRSEPANFLFRELSS